MIGTVPRFGMYGTIGEIAEVFTGGMSPGGIMPGPVVDKASAAGLAVVGDISMTSTATLKMR